MTSCDLCAKPSFAEGVGATRCEVRLAGARARIRAVVRDVQTCGIGFYAWFNASSFQARPARCSAVRSGR
jgi:hypothetical protein